MAQEPPTGQGPIDPHGVFSVPPPPPGQARPPAGGPPPPFTPPTPPPPGLYPPFGMFPPPRPRRSIVAGIFSALLIVVLIFSLILNFLLVFSWSGGRSSYVEETLKSGDSSQKIVVLPVEGLILDSTANQLDHWLRGIESDKDVKAIVLEVNTPGGAVDASDRIHHYLAELKKTRNIPIVVSMGGLAASGGYYVSCGADWIYAEPSTLTGSIGVISPRYNLSELAKKVGVSEDSLTAPTQGFKNAGSPFRPENPKDTAYLQGLLDSAYDRFKTLVDEGRKDRFKAKGVSIDQLANGEVFPAEKAKDKGLVDDIGYLEDAWAYAAQKAGLSNPHVVRYHRRPSTLETLLSRSPAAQPSADAAVNLNVSVDRELLEELITPRPMYLWRGQ